MSYKKGDINIVHKKLASVNKDLLSELKELFCLEIFY